MDAHARGVLRVDGERITAEPDRHVRELDAWLRRVAVAVEHQVAGDRVVDRHGLRVHRVGERHQAGHAVLCVVPRDEARAVETRISEAPAADVGKWPGVRLANLSASRVDQPHARTSSSSAAASNSHSTTLSAVPNSTPRQKRAPSRGLTAAGRSDRWPGATARPGAAPPGPRPPRRPAPPSSYTRHRTAGAAPVDELE